MCFNISSPCSEKTSCQSVTILKVLPCIRRLVELRFIKFSPHRDNASAYHYQMVSFVAVINSVDHHNHYPIIIHKSNLPFMVLPSCYCIIQRKLSTQRQFRFRGIDMFLFFYFCNGGQHWLQAYSSHHLCWQPVYGCVVHQARFAIYYCIVKTIRLSVTHALRKWLF